MADLLVERTEHVSRLTLNRPQSHNALTPDLLVELGAALVEAGNDDATRVIVVTGAGSKAFCSGMDLRNSAPVSAYEDQFGFAPMHLARGLDIWKPVIAAINGYALGGGLELALACDLRIASSNASFGLPEVRIGSIPGAGGTQRLVRQIPQALAMRMLLVGDRIGATKALAWGLVSEVVSADELEGVTMEIADQIAHNAPLAVRAAKQAALRGLDMPLYEGIRFERTIFNLLRDSEDRAEGRAAFAEKRSANYQGK